MTKKASTKTAPAAPKAKKATAPATANQPTQQAGQPQEKPPKPVISSAPAREHMPRAEPQAVMVKVKPTIHRITRLDQAQALAELAKGEKFTDATDVHTDIPAFKSADGRTLRVVLAGDSLNSVEI